MKQSRGDALGRYEPVGSSSLQESLVESPEPHLSVKATLSVTAPSNLPEGYALTVSHNHHSYTVAIPPGGVEAGQTIQVDVPSTSATDSAPLQSPSTEPDHIPVGHWRDDAFNLFRYGVCHPSCLVSVVCPLRTYISMPLQAPLSSFVVPNLCSMCINSVSVSLTNLSLFLPSLALLMLSLVFTHNQSQRDRSFNDCG